MTPSRNEGTGGVQFFTTPEEFRAWLNANHNKTDELWVGYYKKATGISSISWPESVDEALCYGWIDGIRKSIDDKRYKIRFTPRRPKSIWSAVNMERFAVLEKEGRMQTAGRKAFTKRTEKRSKRYSYEQKNVRLKRAYLDAIKSNPDAWAFFSSLPPSVKKPTTWYIMSAKREETQLRRLATVIDSSAAGMKIPQLRRKGDKGYGS